MASVNYDMKIPNLGFGDILSWILKPVARLWFKFSGWKSIMVEDCPTKCVVVAAPHTSNWDMPIAVAVGVLSERSFHWAGKHTVFKWPWKNFMIWLGGIPIHRGKAGSNYVESLALEFKKRDHMMLAVAPEGTRSYTEFWRTGFYYIAKAADVPIVAGYLDYKGKTGGFGKVIYPIGTMEEVLAELRDFYDNIEALHLDQVGPIRTRDAAEADKRLKEESDESSSPTLPSA